MLLILPPAPELAALVKAYWFVEDLQGEHAGRLIRTSPIPLAVLSVNLGEPNASEDGALVPSVSLLGLQSQARTWRSCADTYFVMAMLTVAGIVRLFPHAGSDSAGVLIELSAIAGDSSSQFLKTNINREQKPQDIAGRLDQWFISRLRSMCPAPDSAQVAMAHSILRRGGTVETAAEIAQISRRQLHRLFYRHLGVGPKEMALLERLHSSLRSVQSGCGDILEGFSDQAHQIRSWQQRLGVAPGAYTRAVLSPSPDDFAVHGALSGLAYYL